MNTPAVPGRRSTRPRATVTALAAPPASANYNPDPAGAAPASEPPTQASPASRDTRSLLDRGQKLARICIKRFGDICDDLAADKVFDPVKLARAKRISKRANRISSALVQLITEDED